MHPGRGTRGRAKLHVGRGRPRGVPGAAPRPAARPFDAATVLDDYAIVHWDVDPAALRPMLPAGFDVTTFQVGGRRRALVAAVAFRDTLRFAFAPFARVRLGQVTFRTYARREGSDAVWFFGTTATGPLRIAARLAWKLPWHPARTRFDCEWDGERLRSYRMESRSKWGPASIRATGSGRPPDPIGEPADHARNHDLLTHPTQGYFRRGDGRLATYSVSHPPLALESATAGECRSGLFERLGLVRPGQAPLHVLVQRSVGFRVHLPPRVVPAAGP